jgi:hypothetical protein
MRRREFISVIVCAAAWPLVARAQQPATRPVIGVLGPARAAEAIPHLIAAFRRGLAEAGYVEGKNLAIESRFTNFKPELMPEFAGDLVRLNMNVIFAATPEAVIAVRNATTSIPIVADDLESDPIAIGFVKSLARPGGNMTGMFLDIPELSGKQVGLLKEIVPRLSRIAIFGIPGLNAPQFAATEIAARALALEAEIMEVRVPDDFERAWETARTKHVEGGILLSSTLPRLFAVGPANGTVRLTTSGPGRTLSSIVLPHLLQQRLSKDRRGTCARRVTPYLPRCCMTRFCALQEILGDHPHPRPKCGRNRPDQKANHPPLRLTPIITGGQSL